MCINAKFSCANNFTSLGCINQCSYISNLADIVLHIITQVDGVPYTCNAGGNVQLKVNTSQPHYVTATKPIMVATVVMSQLSPTSPIQVLDKCTLSIHNYCNLKFISISYHEWKPLKTLATQYRKILLYVHIDSHANWLNLYILICTIYIMYYVFRHIFIYISLKIIYIINIKYHKKQFFVRPIQRWHWLYLRSSMHRVTL